MTEARNAIADVLDQSTLAEMRARADPRDLAYMYHICIFLIPVASTDQPIA
jgi:hypothetical protein